LNIFTGQTTCYEDFEIHETWVPDGFFHHGAGVGAEFSEGT
jgi:hypothetical protein